MDSISKCGTVCSSGRNRQHNSSETLTVSWPSTIARTRSTSRPKTRLSSPRTRRARARTQAVAGSAAVRTRIPPGSIITTSVQQPRTSRLRTIDTRSRPSLTKSIRNPPGSYLQSACHSPTSQPPQRLLKEKSESPLVSKPGLLAQVAVWSSRGLSRRKTKIFNTSSKSKQFGSRCSRCRQSPVNRW